GPWAGIHTGPAIVQASESTVSLLGEVRKVAARLKDVAEMGQLIGTELAQQLLRGQFDSARLGSRLLEGLPQPLELFRVGPAAAVRNPIEAAQPAGLAPLTGRDHEVSLLVDRWEQAQEGLGQVVLILGEAGLGKSRLAYV